MVSELADDAVLCASFHAT